MQYLIRTKKNKGLTNIIIRVRKTNVDPKVDIRLRTPLETDIKDWRDYSTGTPKKRDNFKERNKDLFSKLDALKEAVNSLDVVNEENVKSAIDSIVNAEAKEKLRRIEAEKKLQEEESKKVSFMGYYKNFLDDIRSGIAVSHTGSKPAERTRINYQQCYNVLLRYQKDKGVSIDWDDLDMDFFDDFRNYLLDEGYSQNTISKYFRVIKSVVHNAHKEKKTDNTIFLNPDFRVPEIDVDSIYLTRSELDAIKKVDLSEKPTGYQDARDIFLVGVWTAQRISDYNNIKPEDIRTEIEKRIVEGEDGEEDRIETVTKVYVDVLQKKTKKKVTIPANAELREILERRNNILPKLADQVLNRYIKEISRMAGLTETVKIRSTKGGEKSVQQYEKWQLVHSHTARRTGATLMFLDGIDSLDICSITGHQSVKMLSKYIKADELETARKLADKYDYFK